MAVRAISVPLVPFGKLDRDALGSINKDQLARMKIHDLVSSLEPVRSQPRDLGLNIVNGKADMVHANFVQVADVRVWYRMWLLVMKELNLRSWRYILQNQGN